MKAHWFKPNLLKLLCFFLVLAGCAKGSGGAYNDPVPGGTVVASGSFLGCNPTTLTGSALVYDQGNGNYILRLQSLVAPNQSLEVALNSSTGRIFVNALKSDSGNQNYSFSVSPAPSWLNAAIEPFGSNPASPSPLCLASF